jgi:hypothetical protein
MHVADDDAPIVLEYLPTPHTVQDVADNPTDEYVPAAHVEQAVDALANV